VDIDSLKSNLKRLPDEEVYPAIQPHLTTASIPLDESFYVKRPSFVHYEDMMVDGKLPQLFAEEAGTLDTLRRQPHENIVRFHGCKVTRGRITGLVLDRLLITLEDRLKDGAREFDKESCMEGITAGVRHLNSLGLAHNDLKPSNIMLNRDDKAVIIDFGSCRAFGETLITAGTRGWIDEDFTSSDLEHDLVALGKLQSWLESQTV
jgi:serine/threonine protein kinase